MSDAALVKIFENIILVASSLLTESSVLKCANLICISREDIIDTKACSFSIFQSFFEIGDIFPPSACGCGVCFLFTLIASDIGQCSEYQIESNTLKYSVWLM